MNPENMTREEMVKAVIDMDRMLRVLDAEIRCFDVIVMEYKHDEDMKEERLAQIHKYHETQLVRAKYIAKLVE